MTNVYSESGFSIDTLLIDWPKISSSLLEICIHKVRTVHGYEVWIRDLQSISVDESVT